MSEGKPEKQGELYTWRKKIEMIGIDIKSLKYFKYLYRNLEGSTATL
jgi:hypothetical protein